MKKYVKGEITVETAIVMPIVMMIIAAAVYLALDLHDIVSCKSGAYAVAYEAENRQEEVQKSLSDQIGHLPLFVLRPQIQCQEHQNFYEVICSEHPKKRIWRNQWWNAGTTEQGIRVEKRMHREMMYLCRAASEGLLKQRGK